VADNVNTDEMGNLGLNRGEELAIVTEIPGTTRDVIRQSINLEGIAAHIIDTAGLREAGDAIEQEGLLENVTRRLLDKEVIEGEELKELIAQAAAQPVP